MVTSLNLHSRSHVDSPATGDQEYTRLFNVRLEWDDIMTDALTLIIRSSNSSNLGMGCTGCLLVRTCLQQVDVETSACNPRVLQLTSPHILDATMPVLLAYLASPICGTIKGGVMKHQETLV